MLAAPERLNARRARIGERSLEAGSIAFAAPPHHRSRPHPSVQQHKARAAQGPSGRRLLRPSADSVQGGASPNSRNNKLLRMGPADQKTRQICPQMASRVSSTQHRASIFPDRRTCGIVSLEGRRRRVRPPYHISAVVGL
ncbi:hypothetical protein WOLCODRAFT_148753 [Wolfiporia cocos MD-104 SS10]|uniref:Uncharacterized protein n=1 Tax=Wolfiporia cocos (strain MD-104) TaxID=742152 RepID=A0A2H3J6A9_WOLCO|nr:hypothetical protein WOLCODRAFT_148753 [Wolfiporia cocos MD-104 SS10]